MSPPEIRTAGYEVVAVDSIEPSPENVNQGDIGQITESLDANGFYGAILVQKSERRIIAGKHRWLTAKQQGMPEVPVLWIDCDDDAARRIMLNDNRVARLGYDEPAALAALLTDLASTPEGLAGTGFDTDALDELLADLNGPFRGETDADAVPAVPEEPVTRLGDLWVLGEHRLVCGDATDQAAYDAVLEYGKAALGLTDPPYGVGIEYGPGFTDDVETVGALIDGFVPLLRKNAERCLVTSGNTMIWHYPASDWMLSWVEPAGTGHGPWGFICTQPVLAYGKDPYLAAGLGGRPDTFVGKGEGASADDHPVAKPMKVWSWLMERGSISRGDTILDPFAGSGTTLIAAERLGRKARCIEISPQYVDVCVSRWQDFTGRKAEHHPAEV